MELFSRKLYFELCRVSLRYIIYLL